MTLYKSSIRLAAKRLGDARKREAELFLLFKAQNKTRTDNQARAMATIEMGGAIEEAEAAYEIAKAELIAAREGNE